LLEALGNARTVNNHNSSRFAKHLQLGFRRSDGGAGGGGREAGATVATVGAADAAEAGAGAAGSGAIGTLTLALP
jgi:hypothetical protein